MRTQQQWQTYCQLEHIPMQHCTPQPIGRIRQILDSIRFTFGQRLRGSHLELHRDGWNGLHWQINDPEPHQQMQLTSEDDIRRWIDERCALWSTHDRLG